MHKIVISQLTPYLFSPLFPTLFFSFSQLTNGTVFDKKLSLVSAIIPLYQTLPVAMSLPASPIPV
jgi:hypothetical protein